MNILTELRNKLIQLRGHNPAGVDIGKLQRRCTMSEGSYIREAEKNGATVVELGTATSRKRNGSSRYYIHYDNGSDILAVAHLDTVLPEYRNKFKSRITKDGDRVVISSELDDRLGAYIILDMLPTLGVKGYDILLTTDEESGATTASEFKAPAGRQYKWIFEFDRRGEDVVMYDYGNDELVKIVKDAGFVVGEGSFTDICKLTHLKSAAINFGCGYENPHSASCYASLNSIERMVYRFVDFWEKYRDTVLPFELVDRWTNYTYTYGGRTYGGDWESGNYYSRTTNAVRTNASATRLDVKQTFTDFCDITDLEFEIEDLEYFAAPDAQWIMYHRHFKDAIVVDGVFSMNRFLDVAQQWRDMTNSEKNDYIDVYLTTTTSEVADDTPNIDAINDVDEDIYISRCTVCGESYAMYVVEDDDLEGLCQICANKFSRID